MNKMHLILIVAIILVSGIVLTLYQKQYAPPKAETLTDFPNTDNEGSEQSADTPLSIEGLRKGEYPGSEITIEQKLADGSNYSTYIASYKSEGLKIYALLTIPNGEKPANGWPVIIFNHGYIPPTQYRTTERYLAYTDAFSRSGYIVFKSDYRGHGSSEGQPTGAYGSNGYTIDVLNAVASIKKLKDPLTGSGLAADPTKIGMWGHSLGGFITLRAMVVNREIKSGVIWGGVVGSYADMLSNWRRRSSTPPPGVPTGARRWRETLVEQFGSPETNPAFWNSISANTYLKDISGPLQLHHGESDETVPVAFSQKLAEQLTTAGKTGELFTYPGDDHNISNNLGLALRRSVEFFDTYLK